MKTIKNRKPIYAHVFVTALLLTLLLSLLTGIVVAPKPDKLGKPPPKPEAANFEIRIGEGTEDITLNPPNDFLYVEDVIGGYWLPPPTKGKKNIEVWSVGLGPEGGDYCGKYVINEEELANLLNSKGVDSKLEAYHFSIYHDTQSHPQLGEWDYWHIGIQWEAGTFEIPDPPYVLTYFLILSGDTNTNTAWEGEYNETTDTWTVHFNNAWFWLHETTGFDVIEPIWDGQLSFTVEIERIP